MQYKRILSLDLCVTNTCFLWGPRQCGKSTLLHTAFPRAKRYDLLLAKEFVRLQSNPGLIREECDALNLTGKTQIDPILIDEVQKVPLLLDEVHWMIENRGLRFILCGSSARKLKRGSANLLGGRAIRYELFPLVYPEISDFQLLKALNRGTLPSHYIEDHYLELIEAYIADYLKEEIYAEALTRNLPAFEKFLEMAALSNGELIQYKNIAQECGVSPPTVKEYFLILQDTLIGKFIQPYRRRAKRRTLESPKFYYFDVGIVNHLAHRGEIQPKSELFGKAFEHFIFLELNAFISYQKLHKPITFWRTTTGYEVDFILGDAEVAIEIKSTDRVQSHHLRGLHSFLKDYKVQQAIVISLDPNPRKTAEGIQVLPWKVFLDRLWNGKVIQG
ncbi:MAG: ATP-binding protein [Deltaproteobacteria bacterium]|nr:ATP-binding protein [Deltaproteobacteria bacterium]